jgi:uncharacterized NAD(P)/FAD-binding protein YdhS
MFEVVIVGSGPTSLYTIAALLDRPAGLSITVLEREEMSGTGMPFRPEETDSVLLANIASIEVPPICESLLDWITGLPDAVLSHLGISEDDLHERHFFPRILLGAYLRSQLGRLADLAEERGHRLHIYNSAPVVDVARVAGGYTVTALKEGELLSFSARSVVLATGHVWPEDDPEHGYYGSPWPSVKLHAIPATDIGILGSSLSGIDAALSIACAHGRFEEGGSRYVPGPEAEGLHITLMSRKGLLPEADFWCDLPYLPLEYATPERIEALEQRPEGYDTEDLFDLLREEITANDPDYAAAIDLPSLTLENFADAYFAPRMGKDQFALAAANLEEVERNVNTRTTVPWRYAILRMHEALAPLLPGMSEHERQRFKTYLAPVFIDNYAAVPPQTIRRLLALAETGSLSVVSVEDDCEVLPPTDKEPTRLREKGGERRFDHFVDSRGQSALPASALPFPTLLAQLQADPEAPLPVSPSFALSGPDGTWRGLYCAGLPFVMHLFPFAQGITVSHEFGEVLARGVDSDRRAHDELTDQAVA